MTDIDSSSDFTRALTPERLDADKRKAQSAGLTVVEPDDFTLLIDLDGPEGYAQFERVFPRAAELFGLTISDRWPSKSGELYHEHVVVSVTDHGPLDVTTRVALQSILGSDPVRELLALKRFENGVAEPSTLFKPTVVEQS